jgi:hypothetical protein
MISIHIIQRSVPDSCVALGSTVRTYHDFHVLARLLALDLAWQYGMDQFATLKDTCSVQLKPCMFFFLKKNMVLVVLCEF